MPRGKLVYVKAKKEGPGTKGVHWPESKRLEAVATYLASGTLEATSLMTNVPTHTLRDWKRSDWWKEYIQELQEEEQSKLGKRLDKILEKSLSSIEDRLENGDYMYDPRTGKQLRIPPKLREVHKVSSDILERKQKLLQLAKPQETKTQVTADHLVELAKAFASMAQGKGPKEKEISVHEGNYKEVYDELGYTEVENSGKDLHTMQEDKTDN